LRIGSLGGIRPHEDILTMDLIYFYIDEENARFLNKLFSLFGKTLNFRCFVLALWDFCSIPFGNLAYYFFDLYDENKNGVLDVGEVKNMFTDIFGDNFKNDKNALQVHLDLEEIGLSIKSRLNKKDFLHFTSNHQFLLQHAVKIHSKLRSRIVGPNFWENINAQREKVLEIYNPEAPHFSTLELIASYADLRKSDNKVIAFNHRQASTSNILPNRKDSKHSSTHANSNSSNNNISNHNNSFQTASQLSQTNKSISITSVDSLEEEKAHENRTKPDYHHDTTTNKNSSYGLKSALKKPTKHSTIVSGDTISTHSTNSSYNNAANGDHHHHGTGSDLEDAVKRTYHDNTKLSVNLLAALTKRSSDPHHRKI